jgi:hypothetical protein
MIFDAQPTSFSHRLTDVDAEHGGVHRLDAQL